MQIPDLNIPEFLTQCSRLRVLVIGDLMVDHYVEGEVYRVSPEAPVPVVEVERDRYVLGGAANVAANLSGLGVSTTLLGTYGEDEAGEQLATLAEEAGISLSQMGQRNGVKTIKKTRVIARHQQLVRLDREGLASEYSLDHLDQKALGRALSDRFDAVIFSDYAKGVISQAFVDRLIKVKNETGWGLLAMDPKPRRRLQLRGLDLLTPNWSEALELAGFTGSLRDAPDPVTVANRIYELHQPHRLVITLGRDGMLLCERGTVYGHLPTVAREVFDVSGAGDTVVATLAAALSCDYSLVESGAFANLAAGIVVGHHGTAPIQAKHLT